MTLRTTWRATRPDGLAHCFVGTVARALCGMPNQPPIHDWPTRLNCALCTVREEARKQGATN